MGPSFLDRKSLSGSGDERDVMPFSGTNSEDKQRAIIISVHSRRVGERYVT